MLQRIQTVYLLLSVILLVAGCCLPLALFLPEGMGTAVRMNTLCVISADNSVQSYLPITLLVLTTLAVIFSAAAIMAYKDHNRQLSHCNFTILTLLLWVVNFGAYILLLAPAQTTFRPAFGALIPIVAIILTFLARKGVKADRKLLRDAERFR